MFNLISLFLISFLFFSVSLEAATEKTILLPQNTEISVILTEDLNPFQVKQGKPIKAQVKEDILIDDRILIKKGYPVKGLVSDFANSKEIGGQGRIEIELFSLRAIDEQKIAIQGNFVKTGLSPNRSTKHSVLKYGLSGLVLKNGEKAIMPKGTTIKAFTKHDYNIKSSLSETDLIAD